MDHMTESQPDGHTPEGAAVTELILTLFRANGRLLRVGDSMGRDLGLTSARWQVLGAITDTPRSVAQIARYFESTRQGVLWVVTALVKEGLVELIDNPDHKRAKLVRFSERGGQVYAEMLRRQIEWVNALSAQFDLGQIHSAISLLERVSRSAAE